MTGLCDLWRSGRRTAIAILLLAFATQSPALDLFSSAGRIVVANRADGSLSIIDVNTDQLIRTINMPDDGEPTYLAYSPQRHRLLVVDRANDRVVVYRAGSLALEDTVPIGAGGFHCWVDPIERQAWVTNDIDNTVTVFDTVSLKVLETIPMPDDLVSAGYRNHDVNTALIGPRAYVTMTQTGQPGWLLQYNSRTFKLKNRRELGGDPHVSLRQWRPGRLFVMSQDEGAVYVLKSGNLNDRTAPIDVPGAHGGVMNRVYASRFFYTTNLTGGGTGGLVTIDPRSFEVVVETDTPYGVPHNMAVLPNGRKMYLTHSGATANKVTVYRINRRTGVPTYLSEVTVGSNPFGLTYVP